jgi:hypothetical protein
VPSPLQFSFFPRVLSPRQARTCRAKSPFIAAPRTGVCFSTLLGHSPSHSERLFLPHAGHSLRATRFVLLLPRLRAVALNWSETAAHAKTLSPLVEDSVVSAQIVSCVSTPIRRYADTPGHRSIFSLKGRRQRHAPIGDPTCQKILLQPIDWQTSSSGFRVERALRRILRSAYDARRQTAIATEPARPLLMPSRLRH